MTYLMRWIPTLAAVAILVIAAFILDASIRRDKRRKQEFWSQALSSGGDNSAPRVGTDRQPAEP